MNFDLFHLLNNTRNSFAMIEDNRVANL